MKWYESYGIKDPFYADDWSCIVRGDCKDVLPAIRADSISLVIADPPYPREFQYTYGYLADLCPRVMSRGSSLVTIVGHYAIPDVITLFSNKLKYRWMFNMSQLEGVHARGWRWV